MRVGLVRRVCPSYAFEDTSAFVEVLRDGAVEASGSGSVRPGRNVRGLDRTMERRTWWVGDISHESECSLSLRGAKRGVQRGRGRAGTRIGAAILLSGEVTHRGLRPAAASGPSSDANDAKERKGEWAERRSGAGRPVSNTTELRELTQAGSPAFRSSFSPSRCPMQFSIKPKQLLSVCLPVCFFHRGVERDFAGAVDSYDVAVLVSPCSYAVPEERSPMWAFRWGALILLVESRIGTECSCLRRGPLRGDGNGSLRETF